MAPPNRSRPLSSKLLPSAFKDAKAKTVLYSESGRPNNPLLPNIRSLSWSPTGSVIATSVGAHIRIWNPDRPKLTSTTELRNSGGVLEKVSFCPTHEALLASTGAGDNLVKLWDIRVPGGVTTVSKGAAAAETKLDRKGWSLTWHPSGMGMIVGTIDDQVLALDVRMMDNKWDILSKEVISGGKGNLNGMCFSNSGREVFVTTAEGPVKILDWPSMTHLHSLAAHTSATYSVAQSPSGSYLAVGGGDSIISLWDTSGWYCAHTVTSNTSGIRDISFSFDGSYIVAGNGSDAKEGEKGLDISHTETGEHVHTVETVNPISCVAWHPLRYWLAYAGDPGGLKITGPGTSL